MDDLEDKSLQEQPVEPIDGQIGIEELYIRGEEEEIQETPPVAMDGQISFEDIQTVTDDTSSTEVDIGLNTEQSFLTEEQNLVQDNYQDENSKQGIANQTQDSEQFFSSLFSEENIKDTAGLNGEGNTDAEESLDDSQVISEHFIEEDFEDANKDELIENDKNNNLLHEEIELKEKQELNKFFEDLDDDCEIEVKENFVEAEDEDLGITEKENKEGFLEVEEDNKRVSEPRETKVIKSVSEEEKFFETNENSQIMKDVDKINSGYKDVELAVGKDVFADYASNSLHTEKIQDKEVVNIKEKVISENSGNDVVDGMLYKNLDTVLHESMIPYSEHVILDRALPRVEDGLKPVQRRILYSMYELGVTPDKPFRKSARIVGDCLGKYHPHGDRSVYDAMVRMAQPFNTNELLVSGHGNFGSVDGDGAAAMRYTEARLAPLAMELLRDLEKNTVRWGLNFDDTLKEPEVLPGRFPNLLVNGTTGIAVGLATNIPPHNLAEVIDGVVAYINKPSITLKEMLKIIKGPDFPTGGYILSSSEINQAYETGRGKVYLRAKMHIETNNSDKKYIVITEVPYQVNKAALLQKINSFREEDKYGLGAISEVRDESDREGTRAVIRLKKDADVKAVYEALLKYTELQCTFGINMVAIANGKPKQMGLIDIISYYAEYQREVILRRSKYDYDQAKEREHILSGLIIAIKNIDAVVKIIKTSKNTTEAKKRLREKFILSEKQAQAILDMRLARLTSLEVYKLEEELKKLRELIKKLTAIINSKKLQFEVVKEEILQIKKAYKSDRKTKVLRSDETLKISAEPQVPVSQNVIILKNALNNFKCLNLRQFNMASKEITENSTLNEVHHIKFETETTKTLLAFSNLGNCFKVDVKDFGESRYKDKGVSERTIFKELAPNETIVALFDFEDTKSNENLIFLTKLGMIKKTALTEYGLLKKYYQAMKLKEDDEILTIVKEPKDYSVVLVTNQGMVLNAENGDIPLQGRISGGVKGINLAAKDYCVGASLCADGGEVLAVTDRGYAKRVVVSNIDKMARYRKGLKLFTLGGENGKALIYADVVSNPYTIICEDVEGNMHFRSTDLVAIETRIGKGKQVDKLKKGTIIKSVYASRV